MSVPTSTRPAPARSFAPWPGADAPTVPVPRAAVPATVAPSVTAAQTPRLGRRALAREHRVTLAAPRRRYGLVARMLFVTMDLIYGRAHTLEKFMVLEVVARIPYRIWENAAYRLLGRCHRDAGIARRVQGRIAATREQQDNEQWHLLIVGELVAAEGGGRSRFWYQVVPWLMAAGYYHVSWLLFVLAPRWSYRLNADFEDHAEHSYAEYVSEHPELETRLHRSTFAAQYGAHAVVADVLRQIGHDERVHKLESEAFLAAGRLSSRGGATTPGSGGSGPVGRSSRS